MAQTIKKDVRIKYALNKNGSIEYRDCFLSEVPAEDKAYITKIAVLNGEANIIGLAKEQLGRHLTQHIQDYPILKDLYLPVNVDLYIKSDSFKGCPYLKTFFAVGNSEIEGESEISGIEKAGIVTATATDETIKSFEGDVELLQEGDLFKYIVSRESVTSRKLKNPKKYTTDVRAAVKDIQKKIDEINDKIEHPNPKIDIDIDMLAGLFTLLENSGVEEDIFIKHRDRIIAVLDKDYNRAGADHRETAEKVQAEVINKLLETLQDSYDREVANFVNEVNIQGYANNPTGDVPDRLIELIIRLVRDNPDNLTQEDSTTADAVMSTKAAVEKILAKMGDISTETKTYITSLLDAVAANTDMLKAVEQRLSKMVTREDIKSAIQDALAGLTISNAKKDEFSEKVSVVVSNNIDLKTLDPEDIPGLVRFITSKVEDKDFNNMIDLLDSIETKLEQVPTMRYIADLVNTKMQGVATAEQMNALTQAVSEISRKEVATKDDIQNLVNGVVAQLVTSATGDIKAIAATEVGAIKGIVADEFKKQSKLITDALEKLKAAQGLDKEDIKVIVDGVLDELKERLPKTQKTSEDMNQTLIQQNQQLLSIVAGMTNTLGNFSSMLNNNVVNNITNNSNITNTVSNAINNVLTNMLAASVINTGMLGGAGYNGPIIINNGGMGFGGMGFGGMGFGGMPMMWPIMIPYPIPFPWALKPQEDPKKPEEKEDEKEDDKKKDPQDPKPLPKVKVLLQKPIKEVVKDKATEQMAMLKEPKLPWYRRLGKFIARHPFRATLLGLGAGALLATGIGAAGVGLGISGITNAVGMLPYFNEAIMIGAGVGAGAGLVGSVLSRMSRKGRKERNYAKFNKLYKKCLKKKGKIADYTIQLQNTNDKIQELRAKQRGKGVLKSLGVYKFAKAFNRKKMKVLRKMKRSKEKEYTQKVEKALDVKSKLKALEAKSGKSSALGGYLEKKKKLKSQLSSGKLEKEEFDEEMEDLVEDFSDLETITGESQTGLENVGDEYETFDTEAAELIGGIKSGAVSARAQAVLDDIKRRNSKEILVDKEVDMLETSLVEQEDLDAIPDDKLEEMKKKNLEGYKQFIAMREAQRKAKAQWEAMKRADPTAAAELEAGRKIKSPLPPRSSGPTK